MKLDWKTFFLVAGLANFSGSLFAILFPNFFLSQQFTELFVQDSVFMLMHYTFWSFVFVMGIGCVLLWKNQIENRGIALLGGLGKGSAVVCWAIWSMQYQAGWILWGGMVWDGVLGLLFLYWYFRISNKS